MRPKLLLGVAAAACLAAVPSIALARHRGDEGGRAGHASRHVLLISVDGLHAADLQKWIALHPNSALAMLSRRGTTYNNALTTFPSDSSPGITALATGGTPRSTGIYYDDAYDRTLYPPASNTNDPTCTGPPGSETLYQEAVDHNQNLLSGGVSPHNGASVDPANVPQRSTGAGCAPVLPNQFLRVNTIFDVIHNAGLRTAWSDKHPSYQFLNGPEPNAIDDLYTPEINSISTDPNGPPGGDWTSSEPRVVHYDSLKVQAVVDQINGQSSYCVDEPANCSSPGTPAIMGMNFQAVSVGQKLPDPNNPRPDANGRPTVGGYAPDGSFNVNLRQGLQFVDNSLGSMVSALRSRGLLGSTEIIITAKHGQSPVDPNKLRRANPDSFNSVVTNATGAQFPDPATGLGRQASTTTDDVGIVWLSRPFQNRPRALASAFAQPGNVQEFDINAILWGRRLRQIFGDPATDPRVPDVIVQPNEGGLYSLSKKKVAEHGGGAHDDRNVALLVVNPEDGNGGRWSNAGVMTTQVAPTILQYLGLNPWALEAVRIEGTRVLPGQGGGDGQGSDRHRQGGSQRQG